MEKKYDAVERQFGIFAYLTEEPGFDAVVKARYSDFLVHEVSRTGEIARLESLDPPVDYKHNSEDSESRKRRREEGATGAVENTDSLGATTWIDARTKISAWTNEACAEEVVRVLEYWENNSDTADGMSKFAELPAISDKDTRKAIHQWIRASLAGIAVGDTHEGKIRIWHKRFEKETSSFGKFDRPGKARNERLKRWPSDRPDYLQFVLYKENIDTTVAVKDVSKRVKGKTHIGYAGMKDKRGVTSQFCTIYRKQADDILSINKSRDGSGGNSTYGSVSVVRVGNFKYVDRELSLGMLRGNRFDVVLRNVGIGGKDMEAARKYVDKAARAFKKHGFINYFGMQRFGKFRDTHLVGIEVLKGNFREAVELIMRPKTDEDPKSNVARQLWEQRFHVIVEKDTVEYRKEAEKACAEEVLKRMGRFMTCEVALLNSLKRDPLNYRKAFSQIPKPSRLMFLHAVQSVIWNQAVSYRIGKIGKCICVGDLVQIDGVEDQVEFQTSGRKGKVVKVVSAEDVEAGSYDLSDVVVPVVGTKVEYPTNEVFDHIEGLLREWGIERSSFDNVQDRELTLGGDYRKILCLPSDTDHSVVEYYDQLQPLIQTDLMKIKQQELQFGKSLEKGPILGLLVGFTLPPSSYATIALRELMKRPTSSEYQRGLQLEGPYKEEEETENLESEKEPATTSSKTGCDLNI